MRKVVVRDLHPLRTQRFDRLGQIDCVPQAYRRQHQIQSTCAVALVFVRPITHLPQPVEKHGAGKRIAGLAFVQPHLHSAPQFRALQPV